jgi:hypothetical protein
MLLKLIDNTKNSMKTMLEISVPGRVYRKVMDFMTPGEFLIDSEETFVKLEYVPEADLDSLRNDIEDYIDLEYTRIKRGKGSDVVLEALAELYDMLVEIKDTGKTVLLTN